MNSTKNREEKEDNILWNGNFGVFQVSTKSVIVEVVVYSKLTDEEVIGIKKKIKDLIRSNPETKVKYLDHIEPLPSGKHRFVISKILLDLLEDQREH